VARSISIVPVPALCPETNSPAAVWDHDISLSRRPAALKNGTGGSFLPGPDEHLWLDDQPGA